MYHAVCCVMLIGAFFTITIAQDVNVNKLSSALIECYNDTSIIINDNKLPQNIHALIAILRKIEDSPLQQMNLRDFSGTLLHRFRQDGIVRYPGVVIAPPAPYSLDPYQSPKGKKILEMIPGRAFSFPNESLTLIERCSLHTMLSGSIDMNERGDEPTTCRINQYDRYRWRRNLRRHRDSEFDRNVSDVETLSPEELEIIKKRNEGDNDVDPNSFYPELPPNHPENAKIVDGSTHYGSQCPLASGVISTEWGSVAAGSVFAGIAAGLQPQNVEIGKLVRKHSRVLTSGLARETVSNKWIATLAGDLAELTFIQGPRKSSSYIIGHEGHWNSTVSPKYYFMESSQNLDFTAPEIRGDLDGLILANEIDYWYRQISSLKISQILDMYYSDRGVFNTTVRACNRRALITSVAPSETTAAQAWRSAIVTDIGGSTLDDDVVKRFALEATNELFKFIPTMNNDKDCNNPKLFNRLAVDLTIFIDTNWPYTAIQPILTVLLENSEINKYASNFTIINAQNGAIMINNSNSILDFYHFNETQYPSHTRGFDLPKMMGIIDSIETRKLSKEWEQQIGGARSSVMLFIPYISATITDTDKEFCLQNIKTMREKTPDTTILFLTSAPKDRWSDLTQDPTNDTVFIATGSTKVPTGPIINLTNRMKRIPRRLVNSQCGATWSAAGNTASYTDYLEPSGVNYYRMHPNYFFTTTDENAPAVKVQGSSGAKFTVCSSRNPLHINTTEGSSCMTITGETHRITMPCGEVNYIHECNPLYLSITATPISNSINQCGDPTRCRYPDMMKYTISYENLKCVSGAGSLIISPIVLLITLYIYV